LYVENNFVHQSTWIESKPVKDVDSSAADPIFVTRRAPSVRPPFSTRAVGVPCVCTALRGRVDSLRKTFASATLLDETKCTGCMSESFGLRRHVQMMACFPLVGHSHPSSATSTHKITHSTFCMNPRRQRRHCAKAVSSQVLLYPTCARFGS
jgi:hypothetical protein